MAGIDKTYTDNYIEYKKFKEWADDQVLTFFNGHKECIGDHVWEYEEKDFTDGKIPVMNSPVWLDVYLVQHCKSEFVLERMREVYRKDTIDKFLGVDLTARPPDDYKQNRKIIITGNERTIFSIHSAPYGKKMKWWLQCNDDFGYHQGSGVWTHYSGYYPCNTNTAHITSIKAIVRHLRKQYLPKGITFRITGRYIGEEYSILIR